MESGESSEVQSISRELITPIATSLTASLILLGSAALLVSPFGHPIMLLPQFVAAVILVGCLFILPFHLARLCLDRKRIESARVLLWVVFLILFLLPSLIFSQKIRIEGMRAIPESASPILKALREYQGKYGRWPMSLESLTPEYMAVVPATGIGAYPKFSYSVSDIHGELSEDPWTLWVDTPQRFLNFDCMIYLPSEKYPDYFLGGYTESIGKWVYIHE